MHYYPHHIGDYRANTAHLSNEEDLAYRRLLEMYYDTEKPIPIETDWVIRRLRVGSESVLSVLNDFFTKTENGWLHERCEHEIAQYHKRAEVARQNGVFGGRPKKRVATQQEPSGNPVGSELVASGPPVETQLKANQEPRTKNHKPIEKAAPVDRPLDVPDWVWNSFLQLRKTKKAPVTSAALDGIKREADAAGWTLEEALQECCVRGWQGFKADWVEKRTKGKSQDDALLKIRQDEKLSAPMPDKVRQMLKIKRIA